MGGRTDDPRRERTRNAPARHRARAGARQRQRRLPRAGDLPDALLSLAPTAGTLWGRRRAPTPAARPSGAPGRDPARGGAAGAGHRDQRGHLGLPPDRRLPGSHLADPRRPEHGTAPAAPGRLGHAAGAAHRARAPGGADGRTADRPHTPRRSGVLAPRPHAPRRGERAGAARVPGHLLHRQSQRVGKVWQITACDAATSYGLAGPVAGPRRGGRRHVPARGRRAPLPARRLAGAPRAHRRRPGIQGRF